MSVRIGKIELVGIQDIRTEEVRNLVEQKIPGGSGNIFQNLGGEPVTIDMEGIILGEEAYASLEELRQAHVKAKPLPFSADIAVGSDLTDVLIEDFRVKQVAGHKNRYRFTLKVREYTEPPQPADAGLADVNKGILADAKTWAADAFTLAKISKNPAELPGLLKNRPDLLNNLNINDLGEKILGNIDELGGENIGNILKSVSDIELDAALELVKAVAKGENISDLIRKYADNGLDTLGDLLGVDLKKALDLMGGFSDVPDFLKALKEIAITAGDLIGDLRELDLINRIDSLKEIASSFNGGSN